MVSRFTKSMNGVDEMRHHYMYIGRLHIADHKAFLLPIYLVDRN